MRFILNKGALIIENGDNADELNIGVGGDATTVELAELEQAIHFAKGAAERQDISLERAARRIEAEANRQGTSPTALVNSLTRVRP